MRSVTLLALSLALLTAGLTLGPSTALAQRRRAAQNTVEVEVVEVAGGRAFLSRGEDDGVRVGSRATFRSARFRVVGTTRTHSVVNLGDEHLRPGDRGRATIEPEESADSSRLPRPAPLSRHRGMWPEAVLPASSQHPRHVSIGRVAPAGPVRLVLSEVSAASVPFDDPGDSIAWTELRARGRGRIGGSVGFDADAALRLWLARGLLQSQPGADNRPIALVRAAELQLGPRGKPILTLGRLRSAAATVGMLDGVRVRSPSLGPLWLAGFGGTVPDPITTEPALQAARFGVEIGAQDRRSALRPSFAVVGMGSTFEGELDERRVALLGHLFPGPVMLSASLEMSQFPADNPWGAPSMELTAASLDASLHAGPVSAGARFDLWRPEKSRWLDAALPLGFACTVATASSECEGPGEAIVSGSLDAGIDVSALSIRAGGSVASGSESNDLQELSGFVLARRTGLLRFARVELGGSVTRTSFADVVTVRPGVGASVLDGTLDIGLYARPLFYRAFLDGAWRIDQRGGFELVASPTPSLDITLMGEIGAGYDRDSFTLLTTAAWRPLD